MSFRYFPFFCERWPEATWTRKTSWSPSGVNFASRQSALTHTLKPKGQERLLRLVTMYHPAVKIRKQILMEHWSLLHSQPLLKTISTNLWSSLTKKGKSLEDMLVRAKKKKNKIKFEGDTATPHGKSLPLFSCARIWYLSPFKSRNLITWNRCKTVQFISNSFGKSTCNLVRLY